MIFHNTNLNPHPYYTKHIKDWEKWRLAYEGGDRFKDKYLRPLSEREDQNEYEERKLLTPVPKFAAAAIDDVKNAIFQRIADIQRVGGSESYQKAVKGNLNGINYEGDDMDTFIGTEIILELLLMSRVGVLTDNFDDVGRGTEEKHPYVNTYICENICNWVKDKRGFSKVLLREGIEEFNDFGLPTHVETIHRLYEREDDGIKVTFYDSSEKKLEEDFLDIPKIPFTLFQIPVSLMESVADYQISLMNLESYDLGFIKQANFPQYYEYYDPRVNPPFEKSDNPEADPEESKQKRVERGLAKGVWLPKGTEKPGYTNPDPDTLRVSMEKIEKYKQDIRLLINLALTNMNPRRQSDTSKTIDLQPLEAVLSYLGLVFQKGEQSIAEHYNYFDKGKEPPQVFYPKTYDLKSEKERREEAKELIDLKDGVPSTTYKKQVSLKIAKTLVGNSATEAELQKIESEISAAETLTTDANVLLKANEQSIVSGSVTAVALGLPGGKDTEKAADERTERIMSTLEAQGGVEKASAARGAVEFGGVTGEDEKEGKKGRGKEL